MGSLKEANQDLHECVTEILDETRWSSVLQGIVDLLASSGVERVQLRYGFLLSRDLRGEPQAENALVPLEALGSTVQRGLEDGTIEWAGTSDFVILAIGVDLSFMLCNDGDLHFASRNRKLLDEVSAMLMSHGIKVYAESSGD